LLHGEKTGIKIFRHPATEAIAGSPNRSSKVLKNIKSERLSLTMRKSLLALLVLGFSLLLLSTSLFTNACAQLTKLNVASSGISPSQIIPYLAQEAGLYTKNGLEVSIIRTRAEIAVMSLFVGDTPIIQVAGTIIIRSNLKGSDGVFIAAGAVAFDYWLMAAKAIKTAQDLKGKIVGVASLSGSTIVATRYALGKIGLNLDKDIKIIQIGGTPDRLIALRTGRIQATLLSPPTSLAAQKEGLHLLTVASLPFQNNGPVTTRKFIREHPDIVRKYVKAHVEAVYVMKTNREMWIKVLDKYVKVDRDVLEKTYEVSVTEELFPRKQYPSLDAIRTSLDQTAEDEPNVKVLKPESFVDMSFIAELDKSGYIDSLYKRN
jgi:ABC-type nitrate/sulfonate/bicarbonate transport system substrate-binding protein